MSRYIDADKLREEWLQDAEYNANDFLDSIDNQPDANVVPVVHARWEYDMDGIYKCLNCFAETKVPDRMNRPIYEYCPYCGAKMDESVKQ